MHGREESLKEGVGSFSCCKCFFKEDRCKMREHLPFTFFCCGGSSAADCSGCFSGDVGGFFFDFSFFCFFAGLFFFMGDDCSSFPRVPKSSFTTSRSMGAG
jgi:hypothetical protein